MSPRLSMVSFPGALWGTWADVRTPEFNLVVLNHWLFYLQETSDYHTCLQGGGQGCCAPSQMHRTVLPRPKNLPAQLSALPRNTPAHLLLDGLLESLLGDSFSFHALGSHHRQVGKDLPWCLAPLSPLLWRGHFLRDTPEGSSELTPPQPLKPQGR